MQRPNAAVPLTCLALLSACLIFASGCVNGPTQPNTNTQGSTTQQATSPLGSIAQGTAGLGICYSTCRPNISPGNAGLKPGESATFSASVYSAADIPITWTINEGSSGGTISSAGVYTAPSVEGIYHLTVSSTANPSQTSTVTIVVTNTQFTPVAGLLTPRYGHTASLLHNGQVFIAGGVSRDYWDNGLYAVTAELYDPATSTIHASVPVTRWGHSATVLANGDVLLAGGDNDTQSALPTADLFKAATGTIQPTGSMTTPRVGHTATLLLDGRVLLAGGGLIGDKPDQSAELYDPASGKFSPAGDMTVHRSFHSAALLPNGKVLIVGGAAGAELYDPATNAFSWVPGVSANLCQATATPLADGRVLISGGLDCSNTILDTAEIYDPATGQSTPTGRLVAPQYGGTATPLPDGRVLLVGGNASPYLSQIYSPATGSFAFGPHPKYPLWGKHTATLLLDGSVLLVGQDDGTTAVLFK